MIAKMLQKVNDLYMKKEAPAFAIGDSVRVHAKIHEGDKERVQVLAGTVISRHGSGPSATFTVRRISYGVGVERVFPLHSPSVVKVEVERSGHAHRAKLYYLRKRIGKRAKFVGEEEGAAAETAKPAAAAKA